MTENKNCIFCKIARGEIKAEKIYESDNFLAFPDAHPKAKGHTLIIPKKHFTNLMDLPASLGSELLDTIKKVAAIRLKDCAEGFNVIVNNGASAGQVVMHSHIHILPRKSKSKVEFPC